MFIVLGLFSPGTRKRPLSKKAKVNAAKMKRSTPASAPGGVDDGVPDADVLDNILTSLMMEIELSSAGAVDDADGAASAARAARASSATSSDSDATAVEDDGNYTLANDDGDGDDAKAVRKGLSFDWVVYRAAFGDTPYHVAVTTMFVKYAQLVARLTGHHHCRAPMTVTEAEEVGALAKGFVLSYLVPVLGKWYSTKVHKLLAHIIEAIKRHGAIINGDTSLNEALHGNDKRRYVRTSGNGDEFRSQMLRVGQGAVEIRARLAREAAEFDDWFGNCDDEGVDVDVVPDDCGAEPAGGNQVHHAEIFSVDGAASAAGHQVPCPRRAEAITIGTLAQRRGLGAVPEALGVQLDGAVARVTNSYTFWPRMPCCSGQGHPKQHLRATPVYRGLPWFDWIAYRLVGDDPSLVRYGEARAIVRSVGGEVRDVVVVSQMEVCQSTPGCPLVGAGCTRLCWSMAPGADWPSLHAVPLTHVLRLEHIVQDFDEVTRAHGIAATPRTIRDSAAHRRAARFFVNVFYPWP